jgi:hypothetical protein
MSSFFRLLSHVCLLLFNLKLLAYSCIINKW